VGTAAYRDSIRHDLKTSRLATVATVKECARRIDLSARYPSGGNNLEALCFNLSGGYRTDNFTAHLQNHMHQSIAPYKTLIDFALSFANTPTEIDRMGADPDIYRCAGIAMSTLQDSMVATVEGYLGFCPVSARPGDLVCIFLGCMKPMILRPTSDNSCYTVVGPCAMHGLNWGEGLLGPLPDNATFVWNVSGPRGGFGPAFKNRHTGEETIVDPRIDWDLLDVGNSREQAFAQMTALDGSRSAYFKPPDVEYFEKKGVELMTFHLV
jgi:hypothetical protein